MPEHGRRPVFALSPSQGDVDILIAAELMEAGRAVMRGFVTADRTTLIASSHRISAVSEKIEPGDGRASSARVMEAARAASKRFIAFDMEKIAIDAGSVISASLLGALAGSDVLPFAPQSYEDAISAGGRGVKASLAAYAAAFARARGDRPPSSAGAGHGPTNEGATHLTPSEAPAEVASRSRPAAPAGPSAQLAGWEALSARVERLPEPVRAMATLGLRKVVDYQDLAYGDEYIDRLLPESAVIGEYLEERFPDPPLWPADPEQRAAARVLVFRFDDFSKPYYALRRGEDGAGERFDEELAALDHLLGATGWLSGDAFGLADIAYLPWILRARDLLDIPLDGHPGVASWVERASERPSVAAEVDVLAAL